MLRYQLQLCYHIQKRSFENIQNAVIITLHGLMVETKLIPKHNDALLFDTSKEKVVVDLRT